jgi:hypothetical protein
LLNARCQSRHGYSWGLLPKCRLGPGPFDRPDSLADATSLNHALVFLQRSRSGLVSSFWQCHADFWYDRARFWSRNTDAKQSHAMALVDLSSHCCWTLHARRSTLGSCQRGTHQGDLVRVAFASQTTMENGRTWRMPPRCSTCLRQRISLAPMSQRCAPTTLSILERSSALNQIDDQNNHSNYE